MSLINVRVASYLEILNAYVHVTRFRGNPPFAVEVVRVVVGEVWRFDNARRVCQHNNADWLYDVKRSKLAKSITMKYDVIY